MSDDSCVAFLKWCLPRLGLRWPGYRRVHRLVCKRLNRRLAELGLPDLSSYRELLEAAPAEWAGLEAICHIPISRFYRDRAVYDAIAGQLLPELAAMARRCGDKALRCWSAGCASGEEPYTLAMLWRFLLAPEWPALDLAVVATDVDETMLRRANAACYQRSSLRDLPKQWVDRAFIASGSLLCLAPDFRRGVAFACQDIRASMPEGMFHLILCRNLVFTYFDEATQSRVLQAMRTRLIPGGFLVLGKHEKLPAATVGLIPISPSLPVYRENPVSAPT